MLHEQIILLNQKYNKTHLSTDIATRLKIELVLHITSIAM